jgi:hypothetical protein
MGEPPSPDVGLEPPEHLYVGEFVTTGVDPASGDPGRDGARDSLTLVHVWFTLEP